MENAKKTPNDQEKQPGKIKRFFTKRVILGIILAVGILWMISLLLGSFDQQPPQTASAPTNQTNAHVQPAYAETEHLASTPQPPQMHAGNQASHHLEPGTHDADQGHGPQPAAETEATHSTPAAEHQAVVPVHPAPNHTPQPATAPATTHAVPAADHQAAVPAQGTQVHAAPSAHPVATIPAASTPQPKTPVHSAPSAETAQASHETPAEQGGHGAPVESFPVKGMAFVNAIIKPLDQELNHRFWGWRPNDILNFTDNVNNFQLGVLEVTRRSAVILAERISRTGSTASFDPNLENAMNWFMIKADRYWFPSAESKYKDGLDGLREYFHKLERGEATFYNRTDNLIPLLVVYEDLLGSCDENLVKFTEDDGSAVSYFKADNYFFYAKGIASAMVTILEAIMVDFNEVIDSRRGTEVLHHAIESLHHTIEIDPLLITNSDLSGIFANHRANMAATISHARFYLGVLITALST